MFPLSAKCCNISMVSSLPTMSFSSLGRCFSTHGIVEELLDDATVLFADDVTVELAEAGTVLMTSIFGQSKNLEYFIFYQERSQVIVLFLHISQTFSYHTFKNNGLHFSDNRLFQYETPISNRYIS